MNKLLNWFLSPSGSSIRDDEYRDEFESEKRIIEIARNDNGEYKNSEIEKEWREFLEDKVLKELQSSTW
ncbi:hypothetical protein [Pseudomonas aeruginosa]|uniref:hypothetical protein n=1 Tax=Pseudomonas aeruginosa TaxID=287 RepID=UPI00132AAF9E|nr:hypothetical protein [Pseudomonas aeruginosa]MXP71724.1 hypothetical protein [Pseudomonas aeruginosa]MXP89635.1 hypothetical protein [Pseudomonas aeruginosa]MXQ03008.1 hypothetical protein [Pseudomonas aeruginosa]MXQ16352.1 hypothetical protein [Pseudomonas aeruginosa]MXQ29635.1 hypothetical protein [Pseudomonas aeruginosa]